MLQELRMECYWIEQGHCCTSLLNTAATLKYIYILTPVCDLQSDKLFEMLTPFQYFNVKTSFCFIIEIRVNKNAFSDSQ
jgi:hypothetical protein